MQAAERDPLDHLWPCLDAAFRAFPRIVLAACLHALKDPGSGLYNVARHFISHRLLVPPMASAAGGGGGAGAAAGDGLSSALGAGGATVGVAAAPGAAAQQQGGEGGAAEADGAAVTLAAMVLRERPIPAKYVQQFREGGAAGWLAGWHCQARRFISGRSAGTTAVGHVGQRQQWAPFGGMGCTPCAAGILAC